MVPTAVHTQISPSQRHQGTRTPNYLNLPQLPGLLSLGGAVGCKGIALICYSSLTLYRKLEIKGRLQVRALAYRGRCLNKVEQWSIFTHLWIKLQSIGLISLVSPHLGLVRAADVQHGRRRWAPLAWRCLYWEKGWSLWDQKL